MPMPSPVKRPKGEVQQLDLRSKVAALLMEEWPPLDTLDTLDDGMAEREELAYEIAEYIAKGGVVEYRWWAKWIGEIIRMQSFIDEASSPETATRTSKDSIEKDKHEIETQAGQQPPPSPTTPRKRKATPFDGEAQTHMNLRSRAPTLSTGGDKEVINVGRTAKRRKGRTVPSFEERVEMAQTGPDGRCQVADTNAWIAVKNAYHRILDEAIARETKEMETNGHPEGKRKLIRSKLVQQLDTHIIFFVKLFGADGWKRVRELYDIAQNSGGLPSAGEDLQPPTTDIPVLHFGDECLKALNKQTITQCKAATERCLYFIRSAELGRAFKELCEEILIEGSETRMAFGEKGLILTKGRGAKTLATAYMMHRKHGYDPTYAIEKHNAIGNRNLNHHRTDLDTRREFSENLNIVKEAFGVGCFAALPDEGDVTFTSWPKYQLEFIVQGILENIPQVRRWCDVVTEKIVQPFLTGKPLPALLFRESQGTGGGDSRLEIVEGPDGLDANIDHEEV